MKQSVNHLQLIKNLLTPLGKNVCHTGNLNNVRLELEIQEVLEIGLGLLVVLAESHFHPLGISEELRPVLCNTGEDPGVRIVQTATRNIHNSRNRVLDFRSLEHMGKLIGKAELADSMIHQLECLCVTVKVNNDPPVVCRSKLSFVARLHEFHRVLNVSDRLNSGKEETGIHYRTRSCFGVN